MSRLSLTRVGLIRNCELNRAIDIIQHAIPKPLLADSLGWTPTAPTTVLARKMPVITRPHESRQ